MPTTSSKRRRVSGPANTVTKPSPAAQSTLSFGSRITKPSARADAKAKSAEAAKKAAASLPEETKPAPAVADIHIEDVAQQVKPPEETAEEESAEDAAARAVTTTQIGRYWAAKERARKAPRVHQEGLSVGEKVLREFDMESRFGVCCFLVSARASLTSEERLHCADVFLAAA